MTTRQEFIGTISRALGRTGLPATPITPAFRHSVHTDVMKDLDQDELARVFIEYSASIGAEVVETTKAQLNETLVSFIQKAENKKVVLADDPLLTDLQTATFLKQNGDAYVWNTSAGREVNVSNSEKAGCGIAVAKMALAESGTVLLFSQAGCGRSVTLLPPCSIYIIPQSAIKPRLTQGMAFVQEHKNALPSSVNFVSGPSATSDIELVRVVGVHGPTVVVHVVVKNL